MDRTPEAIKTQSGAFGTICDFGKKIIAFGWEIDVTTLPLDFKHQRRYIAAAGLGIIKDHARLGSDPISTTKARLRSSLVCRMTKGGVLASGQ